MLQFLQQLGRVRANDITLRSATGEVLYRSPPPTYKAGRTAPAWFAGLLTPQTARHIFPLPGGSQLIVEADTSRAIIDAWDDMLRLLAISAADAGAGERACLLAGGSRARALPRHREGLERIQRGDLGFRLPPLQGFEAGVIGAAFNRMARGGGRQGAARSARRAKRRRVSKSGRKWHASSNRRSRKSAGSSRTSCTTSSASRSPPFAASRRRSPLRAALKDPATGEAAKLISDEAARLYDNMHGLIPRLTPLSLDTLGLANTLDNLVKDWQRRYPTVALSLRQNFSADLGPSVTLAIYRVVQEGLINALRHAQATRSTPWSSRTVKASWSRSPTTVSGCRRTGRGPATSVCAAWPSAWSIWAASSP